MAAAPDLDLSPYTIEQLEALLADVQKRLSHLRQEARKQAFQQIEAMAKQLGLSKEDIAARYGRPSRQRPNGAPAQYRNPMNPEQTWAGKGRKPQWVQYCLAAGKSLEDLKV
jgi:DNA-binding protein H-NS